MKKNVINAQIRKLRKALKLNQTEFGERIGLKSGAIGKMEKDGGTVIEQNIKLICEKFNVRREWLTEGAGEMLQETEDFLFASFAQRYELSMDDQTLARYLLRLTSEERQLVVKHILEMADLIRKNRTVVEPPAPENKKAAAPAMDAAAMSVPSVSESDTPTDEPAPENLTDEEKEILRQLRLEKSTETSAASPSIA